MWTTAFGAERHSEPAAVRPGLSRAPPPAEDGCVGFVLESVSAAGWVVSACVGVSDVAGGTVTPSLGFLCDVTASSSDASSGI